MDHGNADSASLHGHSSLEFLQNLPSTKSKYAEPKILPLGYLKGSSIHSPLPCVGAFPELGVQMFQNPFIPAEGECIGKANKLC